MSREIIFSLICTSAECVGEAMNILEPELRAGSSSGKGRFLIATVKGVCMTSVKIVATMLKEPDTR